jgi:hypothetical protein
MRRLVTYFLGTNQSPQNRSKSTVQTHAKQVQPSEMRTNQYVIVAVVQLNLYKAKRRISPLLSNHSQYNTADFVKKKKLTPEFTSSQHPVERKRSKDFHCTPSTRKANPVPIITTKTHGKLQQRMNDQNKMQTCSLLPSKRKCNQ